MQKIISLYQRNYAGDHLVRDEVVPGAEWVLAGEGVATRKWDGTCCLVRDGKLYARFMTLPGKEPPPGWFSAGDPDAHTGQEPGWTLVGDQSLYKWHLEAWEKERDLPNGTYELCGPRINGNPEALAEHVLIRHGVHLFAPEPPRDFESLKAWTNEHPECEGIVWHHPDGRMVKIKRRDFWRVGRPKRS